MIKLITIIISLFYFSNCICQDNVDFCLTSTNFNGYYLTTSTFGNKYALGVNKSAIAIIDVKKKNIIRLHNFNRNGENLNDFFDKAYFGLDSNIIFISFCSGEFEKWNWCTDTIIFKFKSDNNPCFSSKMDKIRLNITNNFEYLFHTYSGFPLDIVNIKTQKRFNGNNVVFKDSMDLNSHHRISMQNNFNFKKNYCYVKESEGGLSKFINLSNFKILRKYKEPVYEGLAGYYEDNSNNDIEIIMNKKNNTYYYKTWLRKNDIINLKYKQVSVSYKSSYLLQNICPAQNGNIFFYTKGSEKKIFANKLYGRKIDTKTILNVSSNIEFSTGIFLSKSAKRLIVSENSEKLTIIEVKSLKPIKILDEIKDLSVDEKNGIIIYSKNLVDYNYFDLDNFQENKLFKNSFLILSSDGRLIFVFENHPDFSKSVYRPSENYDNPTKRKLIDIIEVSNMQSAKFW